MLAGMPGILYTRISLERLITDASRTPPEIVLFPALNNDYLKSQKPTHASLASPANVLPINCKIKYFVKGFKKQICILF